MSLCAPALGTDAPVVAAPMITRTPRTGPGLLLGAEVLLVLQRLGRQGLGLVGHRAADGGEGELRRVFDVWFQR